MGHVASSSLACRRHATILFGVHCGVSPTRSRCTYLRRTPHRAAFGVGLLKYRADGTSVFPCSEFKTALRHSFYPFSKLIEACDTIFTRFQNHLAFATPFSPPFDFKTPRCNPAKPYFHSERPFRNLRNLVSISKHPFVPPQNLVSISKPIFANRDICFQNHLALSQSATASFKTVWGCNNSF